MNIYVVRHGQTDWNIQGLVQGTTDIELNDTGKKQAQETAKLLKNVNFEAIYASPLKRTMETASIINKYHNLNIIPDKKIIERNFGDFEGTNLLKNRDAYWNYKLNLNKNNVEPVTALFQRVQDFLLNIYNIYMNTDSNVLIVTHGGTSIAFQAIINNISANLTALGMKNCEVKIFKDFKLTNI